MEPAVSVPRRRWPFLAGAGVLAVATVAVLAVRDGGSCPPEGAALAVGGRVVTVAELDERVEVLGALYGVERPTESAGAAAADFPRDVAHLVAVGLILEQEAAGRDLAPDGDELSEALDRFVAERFPDGGRAQFTEALRARGVAEADVAAEFRRLLADRALFSAVTADVAVSDEEVERAFNSGEEPLRAPERRRIRHLVVATEQQARAALRRVARGESFAEVAQEVSLDAATRAQGGDLGPVREADLDPNFAAVAFVATSGSTFGPVRTEFGWHAGVVEQVQPARDLTLAEARGPLEQELLGEARQDAWRAFLIQTIAEADACYADRFRPADPGSLPPDVEGLIPSTTTTGG